MEEYDENAPLSISCILMPTTFTTRPVLTNWWMTDKEINKIDLGKYKADCKKGLILEVDPEYSEELYDLHNDYLVAPEKAKVSKNMLSR